jgi:hypothetical protein
VNRDRRAPERRGYRLATPARSGRASASTAMLNPGDIAPWVIAAARAWPPSVEDRLVAVGIGVQPQHVQLARRARS